MNYCLLGIFGFILFFLYDFNEIYKVHQGLKYAFTIGFVLQLIATVGVLYTYKSFWVFSLFGLITSAIGIFLLIYALFFALPFEATYIHGDEKRKAYDRGVYALSRHPGVLFYMIFYLGLAMFVWHGATLLIFSIWSSFNILYILYQDLYIFPKLFSNYDLYKKQTPFLFPTIKSIKLFINTF